MDPFLEQTSTSSLYDQPMTLPPTDAELAHLNNTVSSPQYSNEASFFNSAEHFAHDNEIVDEGMLFVFDGLDLGLRQHLLDVGHPIANYRHDVFATAPRNLLEGPMYDSQPPLSSPEHQYRIDAHIRSVHRRPGSAAETRLRTVNERLKKMTTAEKITLLGRIVSEGRVPQLYHAILRRKITLLRKRYQVEKRLGEQAIEGQPQLSPAPEDSLETKHIGGIGYSAN
jgi:hypothetical protein